MTEYAVVKLEELKTLWAKLFDLTGEYSWDSHGIYWWDPKTNHHQKILSYRSFQMESDT